MNDTTSDSDEDAMYTDDTERKTVGLDVGYNAVAEPSEIEYFNNTFGMMRFDIEGATAVLDPKWDRLRDGSLKDRYDRTLTTGDVLRSVQQLPFIDHVDASKVRERYDYTDTDRSDGGGSA